MKVSVAGMLCLDLTPDLRNGVDITPGQMVPSGSMDVRLGGPVFNVGSALNRLGVSVSMSALTGGDSLSSLMQDQLVQSGLPLEGCTVVRQETCAYSLVVQPPGVDRTYWHNMGANALFDGTLVDLTDITLIHIGYPAVLPGLMAQDGAPLRQLLRRAKSCGVATSMDLSVLHPQSALAEYEWNRVLAELMEYIDLISPSIEDLNSLLINVASEVDLESAAVAADRLVEQGVGIAMVTAGRSGLAIAAGPEERLRTVPIVRGCASQWANQSLKRCAFNVTVKDTSCAGDAASAGFLYAVLHGWGPSATADMAVNLAAARISGTTEEYLQWLSDGAVQQEKRTHQS